MSYNLFLDDVKIPTDCKKYLGDGSIYDTEEFKIARNFDEFYKLIKENGLPKFVSFDYKLDTKETGLDCAEFLKFYCEDGNFEIPKYRVHSSWPLIFHDFEKLLKRKTTI